MAYGIHSTYARGGVTKGLLINISTKEIFNCAKIPVRLCESLLYLRVTPIKFKYDCDIQQLASVFIMVKKSKKKTTEWRSVLYPPPPEPQMNIMINMRTCEVDADIKGRDN